MPDRTRADRSGNTVRRGFTDGIDFQQDKKSRSGVGKKLTCQQKRLRRLAAEAKSRVLPCGK
jgi:hypothetical protein